MSKTKSITKTKQSPASSDRTVELQAKYSQRFKAQGGRTRKSTDPCEVETIWAGQHMRAAAEYAKGGDRYPDSYKQRPKGRIADLTPAKLDTARLNVASMTASRLTAADISDVLRIVREDVAAELQRQRRERL